MKNRTVGLLFGALTGSVIVATALFMSKPEPKKEVVVNTVTVEKESLIKIYENDLIVDMKNNYPELSTNTKAEILKTIFEEAKRYNINPLVLYSICHVESSFKYWVEHSQTAVEIKGKKIQVRAVGLGGIIWEWWGDKLNAAKIAETRADLFNPVINIRAMAFVYNENYKMPRLQGAVTQTESALLRHFGGNFPVYLQRIDKKLTEFTRPQLYK